jgi:multidrug resistance efflux pump
VFFHAACRRSEASPATDARPVVAVKAPLSRQIRATGTIQAVRASTIQVPHIEQQEGGRLTLLKLVPNGVQVNQGDILAEFDATKQVDAAREAKAKFEDLAQQVKQKDAQNRSESEKRQADITQADADLSKAEIQLKKGPVLNEILRLQNEEKATTARARLASLRKSNQERDTAERAALRILELQRDRQKVALERAESNLDKLVLKAPLSGMVALETVWRSGSMGNPQEGDRLWNGQPLLKIFDPSAMEVAVQVGEPDGAVLKEGAVATVYLDAYPEAKFEAHFHTASPVATSALGSPIKNFLARFRLVGTDPRLLPDLSAAIVLEREVARP